MKSNQAFTRNSNALVIDPRDLSSLGGTLAVWTSAGDGINMQTRGRLQTLLTPEQFEEAEGWRNTCILAAVSEAWALRGTGM